MATLKELKTRITSVGSTRKITSAMKMIAAARLKQAQTAVEVSRPYAKAMDAIMARLAQSAENMEKPPLLLAGKKEEKTALLIVISSERGLCGGFNGNVVREARRKIALLKAAELNVQLLCIGRKAGDMLKGEFSDLMISSPVAIQPGNVDFADIQKVVASLTKSFHEDDFDKAYIIYNRFVNAITQEISNQQIIPVHLPKIEDSKMGDNTESQAMDIELEPSEEKIMADILPKSLCDKLYGCILDSFAAEQAARMTAMDNASRNAGDMIRNLNLQANRQRQAAITTELTEIISGAEAL